MKEPDLVRMPTKQECEEMLAIYKPMRRSSIHGERIYKWVRAYMRAMELLEHDGDEFNHSCGHDCEPVRAALCAYNGEA